MNAKPTILAYVPVLHRGYERLFEQGRGGTLLMPDEQVLADFPELKKNLPALSSETMARAIEGLGIFNEIRRVGHADLWRLSVASTKPRVIVPLEDVALSLARRYFPNGYDLVDIFLRYDRTTSNKRDVVAEDIEITTDEFHRQMIQRAETLAQESPDFWRQVGAVLVMSGSEVFAFFNDHMPSRWVTYAYGDPRANYSRGVSADLSLALHAEQALIAEAAKQGVSINGADLYVTTFPCPSCAKLISASGIKRVFFKEGYAVLDGQEVLNKANVQIIRVNDRTP